MRKSYLDESRTPIASFSLAPMVGVVFVLACLFLAAGAPARTLSVTLPPAMLCCGCTVPDPLVVAVAADGSIAINDEKATEEALQARLIEWANTRTSPVVAFVVAPDVRHDRVLAVVAYAEQAHIRNITFERMPAPRLREPPGQPPSSFR